MKFKTLSFEKNRNLGSYENVKIGVTVELEEDDNPGEALKVMKKFVESKLKKEKASK